MIEMMMAHEAHGYDGTDDDHHDNDYADDGDDSDDDADDEDSDADDEVELPDYTDQPSCEDSGNYWYDESCVITVWTKQ